MIEENPFTPSFGEIPAYLAGREQIICAVARAFGSSRRRPELTSLFTGARGSGKTALLAYLSGLAEQQGWISASATSLPGLLNDLEIQVGRKAAHLIEEPAHTKLDHIGIPDVVSVSFANAETKTNWRSRMEDMLVQLESVNVGLLITVDEVDPDLDEMVQLASVYQHFVLEGRRVALLMAGLPHNISSLISNKTVSFLRRANIVHLNRIPDFEVADALQKTIRESNRAIEEKGLSLATKAIAGFPFMLQLVGFHAWDENPSNPVIGEDDLRRAITTAQQEMSYRVLEATYRELSPEDVRFAVAMLEDEGESSIADLSQRLQRSSSQIAQYRRRLIDAGVIGKRARGVVGFELPYFREYLQEKVDEEGLTYEAEKRGIGAEATVEHSN